MDYENCFVDEATTLNGSKGLPKREPRSSKRKQLNRITTVEKKRADENATKGSDRDNASRTSMSFSTGFNVIAMTKRKNENQTDTMIPIQSVKRDEIYQKEHQQPTSMRALTCLIQTLKTAKFFQKNTAVSIKNWNCSRRIFNVFYLTVLTMLVYVILYYFAELNFKFDTLLVVFPVLFEKKDRIEDGLTDLKRRSDENKIYDNGINDPTNARTRDHYMEDISKMMDKKLKKYEKLVDKMILFVTEMMYEDVLEYIRSCEFEFKLKKEDFKENKEGDARISIVDIDAIIEEKIVSIVRKIKKTENALNQEDRSVFEFLSDVYSNIDKKYDKIKKDPEKNLSNDLHSILYDIISKETTKTVFSKLFQDSKDYRCCCKRGDAESESRVYDSERKKEEMVEENNFVDHVCGSKIELHTTKSKEEYENTPLKKYPFCFIDRTQNIIKNVKNKTEAHKNIDTRSSGNEYNDDDEDDDGMMSFFDQLKDYNFSKNYLSSSDDKANLLNRYDKTSDFSLVLNIGEIGTSHSSGTTKTKTREKLQKKQSINSKGREYDRSKNDDEHIYDGDLSCKLSFILKD